MIMPHETVFDSVQAPLFEQNIGNKLKMQILNLIDIV